MPLVMMSVSAYFCVRLGYCLLLVLPYYFRRHIYSTCIYMDVRSRRGEGESFSFFLCRLVQRLEERGGGVSGMVSTGK